MGIRILIVEDQTLIRRGLSSMVRTKFPAWEISEAANGLEAISKAKKFHPDIILMDYWMPKMNGLKASKIILKQNPKAKIIIVSAEGHSEFLYEAVDAEVSGIVAKNSSDADLFQAIEQVRRGLTYMNSQVSDKVTQVFYERKKKRIGIRHRHSSLFSDREMEVLKLLLNGNTASQIADQLYISRRTVEGHKANMLKKCQVKSTPDLIRFAISKKLIVI